MKSPLQFLEKGNEHPEWLPDGWNVDFRTRKSGALMGAGYKCYIDPLNGYKFYSKPEVLRYLETVKGSNCTFKKEKESTAEHPPSNLSSADKRQKLTHSATKQQLFAGKAVSDKSILELSDANSSQKGQDVKESAEVMVAPVPTDETVVKMHSLEDAAANHAETKESNPADVQEKNYIMSVSEKDNEENHCSPAISKNKKELNMPHRFSRRLAGIEPDQVANTVTHELAPQIPKRNLRKCRTTKNVDLENKSSQQLKVVPEIKHVHKMDGELLNKSNSSFEIEQVFRDQLSQLVSEKIDDKKPELSYSLSLDSSAPGLKVAMKNMTGEIPAVDDPHSGCGLASEGNFVKENKLQVSQIGKSVVTEICVCPNKSRNKKENHNPCRASKRLAGIEPEVKTNSIDCKRAPEYKSKRSKAKVNSVLQESEGGPSMELADHASTYINAPINGESTSESRKSSKIPPITEEQPEKLGDEEMSDEKSEPRQSIAFHYSWSDPCLEFAIKTLTGVLPIEDSVGNGPNLAPETDLFEKNNLFECAKESGSDRNVQVKLKNKKELKLPCRLSKRLAGHEPEVVPGLRALEYTTRKSRKDEATSTVVLTNGVSKRLDAGKEIELTLDASDSLKSRVLEESSNKSEKSYEAQTVPKEQKQKLETKKNGDKSSEMQLCVVFGKETEHTLHASDSLETRVFEELSNKRKSYEAQTVEESNKSEKLNEVQTVPKQQLQKLETEACSVSQLCLPVRKETEHILHAVGSLKTRVLEDSSSMSDNLCECEVQTVPNEQHQKLEAGKIVDVRSEPQLCLPFGGCWSDPCPEFAIKTLTGALSVDAADHIFPVMTPNIDDPPKVDFLDSMVKSVNEENHGNLNQSQNKKEIDLVSQPSKQLLKQPELRTSSTLCEDASKFANRVSCNDEAGLTRSLDEGESLFMEAGNRTKVAHQYRNESTLIHEEPSNKSRHVLEGEAVPAEQPQFETQNMSLENPESEFCAPFTDFWSDPCLEFAFKTLTGALTVEDNYAIQGCLEEPANCHWQRDGGSTLPDFGSNSFSQSDISSYYDIGDKSMPGHPSSTSLHGSAGVDPQKHYSHCNKNIHGR